MNHGLIYMHSHSFDALSLTEAPTYRVSKSCTDFSTPRSLRERTSVGRMTRTGRRVGMPAIAVSLLSDYDHHHVADVIFAKSYARQGERTIVV